MRLRATGAHLVATIGRIRRLIDHRSLPLWLRVSLSLSLLVGLRPGLPAAGPG